MYRKGRKEARDERDEGTKGGGKVAVDCVIIKIMRIMMCKCMCESESKNENVCEQVSRINDVRSLCLFVVCACVDLYSSVYLSVSVSMSVSISREKS